MDVNLVIWEESSSGGGTRTPDKVVNSHLLYQLSYSGIGKLSCMKSWRIYYNISGPQNYISFSASNILPGTNNP